jgi:hypothetical protein
VHRSSRKCACRREIKAYNAAEPRTNLNVLDPQRTAHSRVLTDRDLCFWRFAGMDSTTRKGRRLSVLRSAAARTAAASAKCISGGRKARPLTTEGAGRETPAALEAASKFIGRPAASAQAGGVLPNPSFKRSTNGRPPAPGRWYAVHFHRPGAGVLPLAPA